MKKFASIAVGVIGGVAIWLMNENGSEEPVKVVDAKFVIDDNVIKSKDVMSIIEPVWAGGNIYESYSKYEESLMPFTREQRLVYAVMWYCAEVNNGGHHQFYSNSTGIVWQDASRGLKEIGAQEAAENLQNSLEIFGGSPSFKRDKRTEVIEKSNPSIFDDIDKKFYDNDANIYESMLKYIFENKSQFYFDKVIKVPENMAPNK